MQFMDAVARLSRMLHRESNVDDDARAVEQLAKNSKSEARDRGPTRRFDHAHIARHEAAHAVAAVVQGLAVQRASVHGDGSGCVEYNRQESADRLGVVLSRLAGFAADLLHESDLGIEDEVSITLSYDLIKARRDIIELQRREPLFANMRAHHFAGLACSLVATHRDAIRRVAYALIECAELDGRSIAALCGRTQ